jgi:hemerythrin-like metal-binding protein
VTLFAWNDQYSVGYSEIDDQHKKLFQMADELHRAMLDGRGKEAISGLLQRLILYTRRHFESEEAVMRRHGYPAYVEHHLEHVKLTDRVLAFQSKVARGETTVTIEVMQFLSDWLRHHIKVADQKVAAYIRQKMGHAA